MTDEFVLPPGMTPSQAIDGFAQLVEEAVARDGTLNMDRVDSIDLIDAMRAIARAARLIEQQAEAAPKPSLSAVVVPFRALRIGDLSPPAGGDAA